VAPRQHDCSCQAIGVSQISGWPATLQDQAKPNRQDFCFSPQLHMQNASEKQLGQTPCLKSPPPDPSEVRGRTLGHLGNGARYSKMLELRSIAAAGRYM
jgi:hypothetical protein